MKIKKLIVAVVALAMTALSAQASFIFRVTVEGTSYTNNENGVSSKNVTTKSILKDAAKEMEVPAKNLVLLWDTLSGVIYIADAKTGEPLAVLLTLLVAVCLAPLALVRSWLPAGGGR